MFREGIKVSLLLCVCYVGPVAQRLEQRTHNPLVPGSNPGGPTTGFSRLTCLLALRLPAIGGCSVQAFRIFTVPSFFFLVFLNILFSAAVRIPIFHAGKRVAGLGVAAAAAWLWALFPVPS